MSPWTEALDAWAPTLVETWRARAAGRFHRAAPGGPDLAPDELKAVAAGITTLSAGLTRARGLVGAGYLDDPLLLGAYLLFYWPVSYGQAREVLGELGRPPGRVLDLGAGPAPLALAALDAGATFARAVDRSGAALEVAARLARARGLSLETAPWDALATSRPSAGGAFDTILAGHLLNELPGDAEARAERVVRWTELLAPGGAVVILEPALKETSRALLAVRDRLVARGLPVLAPCLFRGPCPALARESDWCHAERRFTPPPVVEALARAARLNRDALKMTYLVAGRPGAPWPPPPRGRVFRIVSEPLHEKGKERLVGCGPEGRTPLVLPKKHRGSANAAFGGLQRGDVVRADGLVARGDGLAFEAGGTATVVARAGAPLPGD